MAQDADGVEFTGAPFISLGNEVVRLLEAFGVPEAAHTRKVVIEFEAGEPVTVTAYYYAKYPQLEEVREIMKRYQFVEVARTETRVPE